MSAINSLLKDMEEREREETGEELEDSSEGWFAYYWCRSSVGTLKQAEQELLACVKTPYTSSFINIGQIPTIDSKGEDLQILTLSFHSKSSETPLVMIHGLASGSALFALNYDDLASVGRPVYSIDLLGFGQSSRPQFSKDAAEAEIQFVDAIEAWRQAMKLEKFFLLGHSLGGFLSTSYSIRFPERIAHLILADPWGFKDPPFQLSDMSRIPFHHRMLVHVLKHLNPLSVVRLAGPLGPRLIQSVRADLIGNFVDVYKDAGSRVSNYIFHSNARNATGESAFHAMMVSFGWAKNPMHHRINQLDEKIKVTCIYGATSWVDHCPVEEIKANCPGLCLDHHILDCGHHVYAAKRKEFSDIMLKIISPKS